MNVVYFVPAYTLPREPCAMLTHVYEITEHLKRLGHRVQIVARSPKRLGLGSAQYEGGSIEYVRFPLGFYPLHWLREFPVSLLSYPKFRRLIKDVDIVHERFWVPFTWVNRWINKPLVLEVNHPHVEEYYQNSLLKGFASRDRKQQLQHCNAIITQTATLKALLTQFTDVPIHVIPNGVNLSLFKTDIDPEPVISSYHLKGSTIITFVTTFYPWHGIHQMPFIVREIVKRHKNVKFVLIGEGVLYQEFQQSLDKELRDHIILTGNQPYKNLPALLAMSHILIAPFNISEHPGMSNLGFWWCPVKLFEYMAAGKPIVSCDFPEVRNIVQDAGLLAKPGDTVQFVDYLCQLIEDEDLRKKLGSRGREIAEKEYSWEQRASETTKVYEEALKG